MNETELYFLLSMLCTSLFLFWAEEVGNGLHHRDWFFGVWLCWIFLTIFFPIGIIMGCWTANERLKDIFFGKLKLSDISGITIALLKLMILVLIVAIIVMKTMLVTVNHVLIP